MTAQYKYSKEFLINLIKDKTKELHRTPRAKDMEIKYRCAIINRFKTWNNALNLAGVGVNRHFHTNEELLDMLKKLSKKLNKTPSAEEVILEYGNIVDTLKSRFGSYNNAVKLANIKINVSHTAVQEPNEELLQMYKDFCNKIGKVASAIDLNNSSEIYNSGVFIIRFGGMIKLQELAGFNTSNLNRGKYTKDKIKTALVDVYKKYGRRLTTKEIKQDKKLPDPSTILKYFKTTKISEVWLEIEQSID